MIRKILYLAITVILVSSCGNDKPVKVEFASLIENPSNYIDKNIKVEGKVVEVCPHTGKELFIVGQDPDIMLKIAAGENSPKFSPDLVGSKISVEGRLEKANSAEKHSEEAKDTTMTKVACCSDSAKMGMKKAACCADSAKMGMEKADIVKEAAMCKTEAALAKQTSLSDLMMVYNKHEVVK
jgi:hypothetical protein